MKKKLMALLLAVAVVGMYSFGSIGSVFAEDGSNAGTTATTIIKASNLEYTNYSEAATITFTISDKTEGIVVLDYMAALHTYLKAYFHDYYHGRYDKYMDEAGVVGYSMPGDYYQFNIKVVNESGTEYKYVNNSFNIYGSSTDLNDEQNANLFGDFIAWSYTSSIPVKVSGSADSDHGVNDYQAGSDNYKAANDYFASKLDLKSGETSDSIYTQMYLDGPRICNDYAGANLNMTSTLTLEPVAEETTYSVVANYYTSTDGSAASLDGTETKLENGKTTVGNPISVTAEESWATYNGDSYTLDEKGSTLSATAVLNPASNVLTLNYYRSVTTPVIIPPTPVVTETSYSVVANYYTSTNGGEYVQDNESTLTLKTGTANVGDTITENPQDSWATYNGNIYTYDGSKSTITKLAVLDPISNVLTVNYYRSVTTGGGSDDPDNNNKHDGGGSSDTPKNNNNGGNGSSTGTATNANTPDTGDSMDLVLWSMLGVTSIALAGVVLALRRKEQN